MEEFLKRRDAYPHYDLNDHDQDREALRTATDVWLCALFARNQRMIATTPSE